jgi:hypothetical protein
MKVAGVEVPETVITAAALWMQEGKAFSAGDLSAKLKLLLIRDGVKLGGGELVMRLADRLIQKHKKAGDIVLRNQAGERAKWGWR